MDAHDTVTVEEGDRYPLGPPRFSRCSLMVKHVVWDHELKVRFFLPRPIYIPVVKWIITKLCESLVQGSNPCRGTKYNGDYGVMVAPDSVKVAARDRYPLVTPNYCSPALGVRHALSINTITGE